MRLNSFSKIIESFSYKNIVTNGDFSNGTTGWGTIVASNSVANNTLTNTASGAYEEGLAVHDTQTLYESGKKIFFKTLVRATNANCRSIQVNIRSTIAGNLTGVTINSPVENQCNQINGVDSILTTSGYVRLVYHHIYLNPTIAAGKAIEIKEAMAINLTELFGAGNEPTAADCANIFKFVDGTKQPNFSKILAI